MLFRAFKNYLSNHMPYFRRAVTLRPADTEPYLNLGAILHLRGKLREAEEHYIRAYTINPHQHNIKVNIQRLHNIMRKNNMKTRDIEL